MQDNRKPSLLQALDVRADQDQEQLQQQVGLFGRLAVQGKQRKRVAGVVDRLNEVRAEVYFEVGSTALQLTKQQLCSSLVANSLIQIGAQTHIVNSQAAAVDQRLTRAAMTEAACHLRNRTEAAHVLESLAHTGMASADEVAELCQVNDEVARRDIKASLDRMQKSKDAVGALVDRANDGIKGVKVRS